MDDQFLCGPQPTMYCWHSCLCYGEWLLQDPEPPEGKLEEGEERGELWFPFSDHCAVA